MRVFALSLLTFAVPLFAAAGPLDGALVPECSGLFPGACGLCEVFQLTQNLINFAAAFSALVATVMFVYAGVLYFSASAKEDNIKKAHGIFWKVFIGFVFVLGAWLIVDVIMSVLLNKDFGPWNGFDECGASSVRQAPFTPAGGVTTVPSATGGGNTPSQSSVPAPTASGPASQSWCFEDGEGEHCFTTAEKCVTSLGIAQNAAKTSGASPSECSFRSQSQEPPEDASAPIPETQQGEQTSKDEQTAQQETPTARKSYKEMNAQELTNLFYDMQASFVYRLQLENAAHSILWKTSFPWRVAVKDGAEIVSLRVFPGSVVVGMTYMDKDGNQKTWDGSYGDWGTTSKDSAVTSLHGLFDEVCKTTASDDPIRNVIGC